MTGAERDAAQTGRQTDMARLMLSLPTVMCCYVTQAGKALLCSHAWLHDTRREVSERGEGRRKEEDERIQE